MEAFVRELDQPMEDPRHPPQPAGPPSDAQRQQLMAVITNYMEVLTPDPLVSGVRAIAVIFALQRSWQSRSLKLPDRDIEEKQGDTQAINDNWL